MRDDFIVTDNFINRLKMESFAEEFIDRGIERGIGIGIKQGVEKSELYFYSHLAKHIRAKYNLS